MYRFMSFEFTKKGQHFELKNSSLLNVWLNHPKIIIPNHFSLGSPTGQSDLDGENFISHIISKSLSQTH